MDILNLVLTIVAFIATIFIAAIPLRHDVYDKVNKKYTRAGKWFLTWAVVAISTGTIVQIILYVQSSKVTEGNKQQQTRLNNKIEELQKSSAAISGTVHNADSIEMVSQRRAIIDSLTLYYSDEFRRLKKSQDSSDRSRQRHLDKIGKRNLVKRLNDLIVSQNLPPYIPIEVGYSSASIEALKYAQEISNYLNSQYHSATIVPTMGKELLGFKMRLGSGNYILIDVGIDSVP